ncbi:MAG: ribosome biogenesis GTPase Der [Lawsonella sp.]
MTFYIAVDGPSGAGKSTVCRAVANALGLAYLDTGAMYRIVTLAALQEDIAPTDLAALEDLLSVIDIQVSADPESTRFYLGGVDVSDAIREDAVTRNVSAYAAIPAVRTRLVAIQRELAQQDPGAIVDGRDIGTVVLPNAPLKIFLTASAEARAQRRHEQDLEAGRESDYKEVLASVIARDKADTEREVSPLTKADDAIVVDSTGNEFEETVEIITHIARTSMQEGEAGDEADAEESAEAEWDDLAEDYLGHSVADEEPELLPVVAIVGRPNVGKSTLVNRLIGRREAVVEDFSGVTRDRNSYEALWNGRRFMVMDTGGWEPDAKGIHREIAQQAEAAMKIADIVVLVVDSQVGITTTDEIFARNLVRADIPVLVAANKSDSPNRDGDAAEFWGLALGEPFPVSSLHGRGAADLLDRIVELLPDKPRYGEAADAGVRRIAIVGKPNVGKSSLFNKLSGQNRSVVHDESGTTVDPVDSVVEIDGKLWKFIDTAGLRKRVKHAKGHEYYASLRTQSAIEAAEVIIIIIDASQPITEQDQRVISMAIDAGRAVVIAYNKWDLVDEDRRYDLRREVDREMSKLWWAKHINISATTGRSVHKLIPAVEEALESWDKRIPTGRLNKWIRDIVVENPPPMRGGRLPKIMFVTQAKTRPPTFVVFSTRFLEASYRRFLERKLRETFGFDGSPVRVNVRVRERAKK